MTKSDNALILDHLARSDIVDGLQKYSQEVITEHELFMTWLRDHMGAIVEIIAGGIVRKRVEAVTDLEAIRLWGEYENAPLFIEWGNAKDTSQTHGCPATSAHGGKRIKRFVLFGYHPQAFLFVWGPRQYRKAQDLVMQIASKLTKTPLRTKYFSTLEHITKDKHTRLAYEATHQWTQDCQLQLVRANGLKSHLLPDALLPPLEPAKDTVTVAVPDAARPLNLSKAVPWHAASQTSLNDMTRVTSPVLDTDQN